RNTIFYNTLFDENAACHLAIGSAYAFNIQGGTEMTVEEKIASQLNVLTLAEMKKTIHDILDFRDEDIWMLFGTLPVFPCLK
ncbi:aminopeptidase, partial [Staphylococcus sp. EG-SA-8]|uniref:aminopeptidase n=1 Tax=Staphylococcus sp. EG-SA-8 TaxID=2767487 RepID=UPI001F120911